jgi:hypothetical protein
MFKPNIQCSTVNDNRCEACCYRRALSTVRTPTRWRNVCLAYFFSGLFRYLYKAYQLSVIGEYTFKHNRTQRLLHQRITLINFDEIQV